MKYRVFLCEHIHPAAYEKLRSRAEILTEPDQLPLADAAINRNLRMDRAWLDRCPVLKVIGVHGTGTDGVDLAAARERGIRVVYAPGENARSVAELIALFALSLNRHAMEFDRRVRSGEAPVTGGGTLTGRELFGRTFGLIGCGTIGLLAGDIMNKGFGMKIAGCSPSLTPLKAAEMGIEYCAGPAEVLAKSDITAVCTPLNSSTRGMVDAALLSHAKPGSMLINTARGGIVDEKALYDALVSGRLAAAACDVFAEEPPTAANPLVSLPNFIATPHIGAATEEALYRVSTATVDQVLAVLDGKDDGSIRFAGNT